MQAIDCSECGAPGACFTSYSGATATLLPICFDCKRKELESESEDEIDDVFDREEERRFTGEGVNRWDEDAEEWIRDDDD